MAETMNIQTDVALIWGHCPIGSFRHWQVGLRWWWGGGWKKGHSLIAWQSEWSFFSPFSMTCRLWEYTNEARQTKGVQRLGPSGFLVITIALFTNDAAVATKRALLSASPLEETVGVRWTMGRCPCCLLASRKQSFHCDSSVVAVVFFYLLGFTIFFFTILLFVFFRESHFAFKTEHLLWRHSLATESFFSLYFLFLNGELRGSSYTQLVLAEAQSGSGLFFFWFLSASLLRRLRLTVLVSWPGYGPVNCRRPLVGSLFPRFMICSFLGRSSFFLGGLRGRALAAESAIDSTGKVSRSVVCQLMEEAASFSFSCGFRPATN